MIWTWLCVVALGMPHDLEEAACTHCHLDPHALVGGGVDDRPCVACHALDAWTPSTFTTEAHASTAFALEGRHLGVECGDCHLGEQLRGLPTACAGCHVDRHRGKLGDQCTTCHSVEGFTPVPDFDHSGRTGFALTSHHGDQPCAACHEGTNGQAMRVTLEPGCATCHTDGHGAIGTCVDCHAPEHDTFADAARGFDHRPTSFRLERRHRALSCSSCHQPGQDRPPEPACVSCHVDVHAGQLGTVCSDCHRPDRWALARFDHDRSGFPLRGRHFVAPCGSCHANQSWIGLSPDCFTCHQPDLRRAPGGIAAHGDPFATCEDCHSVWSWSL